MNGEITVRDFVNGLAKSPFYKESYFHSVAPQRGIELNFKHLLGRAPLTQEEVQNSIKLQAEDGIRDQPRSRGLGDVYKRQRVNNSGIIQKNCGRSTNDLATIKDAMFTLGDIE